MVSKLETLFPGLQGTDYRVTSPPERQYNCIAWAAGDQSDWWWPDSTGSGHWPPGVPRSLDLQAFQSAYATLGYVPCDGEQYEPGFEKIALFARMNGTPTHAARQLPSGRWPSKLGRMEDIEHELHDVSGAVYGAVAVIMKRPAQ
jgi:hypothetical protein